MMLWGSWKVLWFLIYCKYFRMSLTNWGVCVMFAMFQFFYVRACYGFAEDRERACCGRKVFLVIVGR